MNFYYYNNSLAHDQLKQIAELYHTKSSSEGDDPAQSGAKAMARGQLEIWALTTRRTRAALGLPSQLATCKTPQDFMSTYFNFWLSTFTDSADTTKRISELIGPRSVEAAEALSETAAPEAVKVIRSSRDKDSSNSARSSYQGDLRQAS